MQSSAGVDGSVTVPGMPPQGLQTASDLIMFCIFILHCSAGVHGMCGKTSNFTLCAAHSAHVCSTRVPAKILGM
jgi:hypothetical protein